MDKKQFNNIASLLRTKRESHPKRPSQSQIALLLGYKNGQFISNIERGLCGIPYKSLKQVCEILSIEELELREAILNDERENLERHFAVTLEPAMATI